MIHALTLILPLALLLQPPTGSQKNRTLRPVPASKPKAPQPTPQPTPRLAPRSAIPRKAANQISVEVRFITCAPDILKDLNRAALMHREPATTMSIPTTSAKQLASTGGIQLVSATTKKETKQPVFIELLNDTRVRNLINVAHKDQNSNVLFAPKIAVWSGQNASIKDGSQRPFVTTLKKVESEFQPGVETIETGTRVDLRATERSGAVQLDLAVLLNEVSGVKTTQAEGDAVVQVPEVKSQNISLSAMVPTGQSVAVWGIKRTQQVRQTKPVLGGKVPYLPRAFKNTSTASVEQQMVIVFTPQIVSE